MPRMYEAWLINVCRSVLRLFKYFPFICLAALFIYQLNPKFWRQSTPETFCLESPDSNGILIVGAGLAGAVMAHLHAVLLNRNVTVIEKRNHIGGTLYDYRNELGILIPKFGFHHLHTSDEAVWRYALQFGDWDKYEHRAVSQVGAVYVPVPPNIQTVNLLLNQSIEDPADFAKWVEKEINLVGDLYAGKVKGNQVSNYESLLEANSWIKGWNRNNKKINPTTALRRVLPNFDDGYFQNEKYNAIPKLGFTELIRRMLSHPKIKLKLNEEYCQQANTFAPECYSRTIYTGAIDTYFSNSGLPTLETVWVKYEVRNHYNVFVHQPSPVVYYPSRTSTGILSTTEPKHIMQADRPRGTSVITESISDTGDIYFFAPTIENEQIFQKYEERIISEESGRNITFISTLPRSNFYNMAEVIANTINKFLLIHPLATEEDFDPAFGRISPVVAEYYYENRLPSVSVVISRENQESLAWLEDSVLDLCEHRTVEVIVYNQKKKSKIIDKLADKYPYCILIQEHFQPRVQFKEAAFLYHMLSRESSFKDINIFMTSDASYIADVVNRIGNRLTRFSVGEHRLTPTGDMLDYHYENVDDLEDKQCVQTSNPQFDTMCTFFKQVLTTDQPCGAFTTYSKGEFAVSEALLRRMLSQARTGLWNLYSASKDSSVIKNLDQLGKLWFNIFLYPSLSSC